MLKRKTGMFAAPALSILGTKMKCLLFQQSGGSLCLFASTEELPCLSKFSLISSAGWSRWRWQGIWPGLKGTDGWTPWPNLPTLKCIIHFLHCCDPRQTTDFAGNTYQTSSVGPHEKNSKHASTSQVWLHVIWARVPRLWAAIVSYV